MYHFYEAFQLRTLISGRKQTNFCVSAAWWLMLDKKKSAEMGKKRSPKKSAEWENKKRGYPRKRGGLTCLLPIAQVSFCYGCTQWIWTPPLNRAVADWTCVTFPIAAKLTGMLRTLGKNESAKTSRNPACMITFIPVALSRVRAGVIAPSQCPKVLAVTRKHTQKQQLKFTRSELMTINRPT